MDCDEIKESLSAYVDDVLDAESKAVVEEHLSTCKDCQQELVSLQALVRELGSLESVEPPKDFLDQLHERMEARSWFPKILRTLFVPFRVKIPLEFAGAVAVAILVFSVLHIQKEPLRLAGAPEGLKQEKAGEQVAKEKGQAEAPLRVMEESVYKERAVDSHKPQLAYKEATAERPPAERQAIELALVMKKEIPPEPLAPEEAMEAAPAPKKKMRRSLASPQAGPSVKPEWSEELDESLAKLKKLIEVVGGEVVSVEYNEETHTLESIWAEIPIKQMDTFYIKLKTLGDLQAPPKAVAGEQHEVLPVCIRLLPSE